MEISCPERKKLLILQKSDEKRHIFVAFFYLEKIVAILLTVQHSCLKDVRGLERKGAL